MTKYIHNKKVLCDVGNEAADVLANHQLFFLHLMILTPNYVKGKINRNIPKIQPHLFILNVSASSASYTYKRSNICVYLFIIAKE